MAKSSNYDKNHKLLQQVDTLCHVIRTPLQLIMGISEKAIDDKYTKIKDLEHYKDMLTINKNTDKLLDLVESLISAIGTQYKFLQFPKTSVSILEESGKARRKGNESKQVDS